MKNKQFFVILSALGLIFLLCWLAVIVLAIINLRGLTNKSADPVVIDVTLCDVDSKDLCIVNFGANNLNRMVINFQLPDENYPAFYVKAANRDIVSVYTCEVIEKADETELLDKAPVDKGDLDGIEGVETEVVKAVPASVHCAGVRTPLGETIDIEIYTTDEDKLIARGTFLVSAIALSTPISQPPGTPSEEEETPTPFFTFGEESTPTQSKPTQKATQTQNEPTNTPTATPDIAYP